MTKGELMGNNLLINSRNRVESKRHLNLHVTCTSLCVSSVKLNLLQSILMHSLKGVYHSIESVSHFAPALRRDFFFQNKKLLKDPQQRLCETIMWFAFLSFFQN